MSLLDAIKQAGIVGAGGAGFPTHIKLGCRVEYLLVNAVECEPLLHTDKYILKTYPTEVVKAMDAVGDLIGAENLFIAIKDVNTKEIESMQQALQRCGSRAKIFPMKNYYPAGDEQMVVYDVTGRVVPPGGLPLDVGAVVSNVATMLNIYDAMQDKPVTEKFLTVAGQVAKPAVLQVPVGISFRECIEACGGALPSRFKVVNGGPMMGQVSDGSELDRLYVTKTTSGILIIPEDSNFVSRLKDTPIQKILNRAKSACIQCSFCTDLCPRQLIGHQLRPHRVMRQMAILDFDAPIVPNEIMEEALACCDCGVCETYACPMGLSPRQVNKYVKGMLAGKRPNRENSSCKPHVMREHRKIAPKQIMSRMGLVGLYDNTVTAFHQLQTSVVRIPVKQHIGVPAEPVVEVNAQVTKGQLIARGVEGKPSANIHASISGTVTEIGSVITIQGGAK